LFRWLKHTATLSDQEMLETFNCGIGMALIADPEHEKSIITQLAKLGMAATTIGKITHRKNNTGITFEGEIPIHAMKVLVVGDSSAEHALAWKFAQSPHVGLVLVAPGNGGTAQGDPKIKNIPINPMHSNALLTYAQQNKIDLVIVGPKKSLANGFIDDCRKKGLRCVGPTKSAMKLESDEAFISHFVNKNNIPMLLSKVGEISICLCIDGNQYKILSSTRSYKKRDNGDSGPETPSMGSHSPALLITPQLEKTILHQIIEPTIRGMKKEGIMYSGFLTINLEIKEGKPYLRSYTCHLNDAEIIPLILRLKTDLFSLCDACIDRSLDKATLEIDPRPALSVVATTNGYPEAFKANNTIIGIPEKPSKDALVFQGETNYYNGKLITTGGKVLCAATLGDNLNEARNNAYALIRSIYWPNMHYRSDIGYQALS
jgi:phosphoribosylamine-glycine ligase